jgi:16S rRNA (guanine(966)-N(2))-methyltransferase RsmD
MSMRVIAGKFGRRKLAGPSATDGKLRPTSDKLRETLFNILGAAVEGSVFVDVFAGTGAVGIEALSRGAREVIWVEKHRPTAALIRKNLSTCGELDARETTNIFVADGIRGIEQIAEQGTKADFVFLDPPYEDYHAAVSCLETISRVDSLAPQGKVIIEHSRRREMPARVGALERIRVVEQGDASLSFYKRTAGATDA